ncbi:uncharacterized protein LOC143152129 isoform X2 [Ptiloglossa arizonensis]|uniref:uncharacterized protein LOC143152129 isoform X2 n=1 Tax=Ptiloglossa arizonensis TaxID=3350558 RepID=UPI003F9EBDE4
MCVSFRGCFERNPVTKVPIDSIDLNQPFLLFIPRESREHDISRTRIYSGDQFVRRLLVDWTIPGYTSNRVWLN